MKKKKMMVVFGFILLASIFYVSAVETSYCCEKLKPQFGGAFCQNAPLSQCDTTGQNANTGQIYKTAPTSCEATSYCRMGCCNVIDAGECMKNTPLATCGGQTIPGDTSSSWSTHFIENNPTCDVDQCKLGCCLMGDQAAFVTQTKCNKLSALYGLEINFREDITSETECLASATVDVKGACVFEKEFTRTCKMITQRECSEMKANTELQNVKFYEKNLCSNPELGTECAMSQKTTCIEGKDEIYYVDTCGNVANIYDASKAKDTLYWSEVVEKQDVECDDGNGNKKSSTCGVCDYVKGSTCKEFTRKDFKIGTTSPEVGNFMCKDLSCQYDNNGDGKLETYLHGETWCAHAVSNSENIKGVKYNSGTSVWHIGILPIKVQENGYVSEYRILDNKWYRDVTAGSAEDVAQLTQTNLPGSRYFRMMCYNGEVIVEPCADFRQEVCIEDSVTVDPQATLKMPASSERESFAGVDYTGFRGAACRMNRWQDCGMQKEEQDCMNIEARDCKWANLVMDAEGKKGFRCVPLYPPGLKFWGDESADALVDTGGEVLTNGEIANDANAICSAATASCEITYQVNAREADRMSILGPKGDINNPGENLVVSGYGCFNSQWQQRMQQYGLALGDCGTKNNYAGKEGSSFWSYERSGVSAWN